MLKFIFFEQKVLKFLLSNSNLNYNIDEEKFYSDLSEILAKIAKLSNGNPQFVSFIPKIAESLEGPCKPIWWQDFISDAEKDSIRENSHKDLKTIIDKKDQILTEIIEYGYLRVSLWLFYAKLIYSIDSNKNDIYFIVPCLSKPFGANKYFHIIKILKALPLLRHKNSLANQLSLFSSKFPNSIVDEKIKYREYLLSFIFACVYLVGYTLYDLSSKTDLIRRKKIFYKKKILILKSSIKLSLGKVKNKFYVFSNEVKNKIDSRVIRYIKSAFKFCNASEKSSYFECSKKRKSVSFFNNIQNIYWNINKLIFEKFKAKTQSISSNIKNNKLFIESEDSEIKKILVIIPLSEKTKTSSSRKNDPVSGPKSKPIKYSFEWNLPEKGVSCYYIGVNDSGAGINCNSAIKIVKKMQKMGLPFCVITEAKFVFKQMAKINVPVKLIDHTYMPLGMYKQVGKDLVAALISMGILESMTNKKIINIFSLISNHMLGVSLAKSRAHYQIERQYIRNHPLAFLSIAEGGSLDCSAGYIAKKIGSPWISWTHVLISDTPNYRFFPSEHHVIYGDHGAKILKKYVDSKNIVVAGSPQYDTAYNRDAEKDIEYCRTIFRNWKDEPLIVVGTQNIDYQQYEIKPILEKLYKIPGIYIVVKLHPASQIEGYEQVVSEVDDKLSKITVVRDMDIMPLLNTASLLLTKYSNIVISASIMRTPTLIFDFINSKRSVDFVEEGICDGIFKQEEFHAKVNTMLFDENAKNQAIEKALSNLSKFTGFNDGRSCDHVIQYIINQSNKPPI